MNSLRAPGSTILVLGNSDDLFIALDDSGMCNDVVDVDNLSSSNCDTIFLRLIQGDTFVLTNMERASRSIQVNVQELCDNVAYYNITHTDETGGLILQGENTITTREIFFHHKAPLFMRNFKIISL
jgi:hypothetical protein